MNTFSLTHHESRVNYYSKVFPGEFAAAKDSFLFTKQGKRIIDFFSAAGSLNFGHNHPVIKRKIIDYLERDGITNSLDLITEARKQFIESLVDLALRPRGLDYKVQFPGPTGTNAIEASIRLARKITGRDLVVYFKGSFHGMTLGAYSLSDMAIHGGYRDATAVAAPYCGHTSSPSEVECILSSRNRPAAVLLETVQCEGGVRIASDAWLNDIFSLCGKYNVLLIVDDIQAGVWRTGKWLSFEETNILPDIVCLSKSLSGFGLPMSIVLLNPSLDIWKPGEYSGTFRGNNLAFVAARAAIELSARSEFQQRIGENSAWMAELCQDLQNSAYQIVSDIRWKGLIAGLELKTRELAASVQKRCYASGLMVERCGPQGRVLKLLPSVIIDRPTRDKGAQILRETLAAVKRIGIPFAPNRLSPL